MAGFKNGKLNANYTAYAPLLSGTVDPGLLQSVSSLGTDGQALTSNGVSSSPTNQTSVSKFIEWQSITSGSLPLANSFEITSGLGSTYDNYLFIAKDVTVDSGSRQFLISVSDNGGTNYNVSTSFFGLNNSTTQREETPPMSLAISGFSTSSISAFVQWNANNLATFKPCFSGLFNAADTGTTLYNGLWETTNDIDAIEISLNSSNFATGTYELWGK